VNPPKPTPLKRLEGTWRPDRANPAEPEPPKLLVGSRPPRWLRDKLARRYWRELVETLAPIGILAVTDQTALALLAHTFGEWRRWAEACERIDEPTYGDQVVRLRPEFGLRDEAEKRLLVLLREFGLTPSSRTRIRALGAPASTDPAEEFLRGRRPG
jgi:P27 family predicted phage terminase small subunit